MWIYTHSSDRIILVWPWHGWDLKCTLWGSDIPSLRAVIPIKAIEAGKKGEISAHYVTGLLTYCSFSSGIHNETSKNPVRRCPGSSQIYQNSEISLTTSRTKFRFYMVKSSPTGFQWCRFRCSNFWRSSKNIFLVEQICHVGFAFPHSFPRVGLIKTAKSRCGGRQNDSYRALVYSCYSCETL